MRKIAINKCYGGFGLSKKAGLLIVSRKKDVQCAFKMEKCFFMPELQRDDSVMITVIEELGKEANAYLSDIKIVEIPADVQWEIADYDGIEWIAEKHRTWE
jgi:hypothetical protein